MITSPTRDRILDALQDILIEEGNSGVTLESVAAAAGVSKGGLLYHFPSKSDMLTGLVRRLAERAEDEFRAAAEGEEGVVRAFLRTSVPESAEETELFWSIIAALRSKEDISPESRELIRHLFQEWSRLLHDEVGDPVLAEMIRLVGDGLYLTTIAGLPQPDPDTVRQLTERLVEQSDAASARKHRHGT
ncbi:TetR/AcrR family transcriptional regulator [Haloactinospora alba]|uniref:TetR/AcrR family transcriptional regulator n=1 Tax=Haloactinospora alba TaxID=405555 RepID=UPI0011512542|nr:TetR/AcrR family transcriptional regulator [Haloactinospora alba]